MSITHALNHFFLAFYHHKLPLSPTISLSHVFIHDALVSFMCFEVKKKTWVCLDMSKELPITWFPCQTSKVPLTKGILDFGLSWESLIPWIPYLHFIVDALSRNHGYYLYFYFKISYSPSQVYIEIQFWIKMFEIINKYRKVF